MWTLYKWKRDMLIMPNHCSTFRTNGGLQKKRKSAWQGYTNKAATLRLRCRRIPNSIQTWERAWDGEQGAMHERVVRRVHQEKRHGDLREVSVAWANNLRCGWGKKKKSHRWQCRRSLCACSERSSPACSTRPRSCTHGTSCTQPNIPRTLFEFDKCQQIVRNIHYGVIEVVFQKCARNIVLIVERIHLMMLSSICVIDVAAHSRLRSPSLMLLEVTTPSKLSLRDAVI